MIDPKRKTQLGETGPSVFPIALGCMAMSGAYGPSDENEGIATIRDAIERGVTLIDTGDFYGNGHNELLLRRALEGRRDKVQLSVKFGAMRAPDGAFVGFDARPAADTQFQGWRGLPGCGDPSKVTIVADTNINCQPGFQLKF